MEDPRLLLVEDEPSTRIRLEAQLQQAGFRVTAVASAEQALVLLQTERFALLITGLQLQNLNGVALLVTARTLDPDLEVLVLTGPTHDSTSAADNDEATALQQATNAGELEARVRVALEHQRERLERGRFFQKLSTHLHRIMEAEATAYRNTSAGPVRVGRLELDPLRHHAAIDRRAVPLSRGEFDLLLYMARRNNQVLSAEILAREVLHYAACSPTEARELVKARIHRLRQKIEADPRAPDMIVSIRGAGYMLTGGNEA